MTTLCMKDYQHFLRWFGNLMDITLWEPNLKKQCTDTEEL